MNDNDWTGLLRHVVACSTQQAIASELGISKTTISQVLSNKYPANTARIQELVMERYGAESIHCPVLGAISRGRCAVAQTAEFSSASPQRVALWLACRTCNNNIIKDQIE